MRESLKSNEHVFPLLIAEVANCHGGDKEYLVKLVELLTRTNVDAIKFQIIFAEELISRVHSTYPIFKSFEFESDYWKSISEKVKSSGKTLIFDIFGQHSLKIAISCLADIYKIHATDFDNTELIKEVLRLGSPIFLATGGSTLEEIDQLILSSNLKKSPLCLMTGIQKFPTPINESNLNKIEFLKTRYKLPVGFMDHTDSSEPFSAILPCLAVQKGACTVEKHVYLKDSKTSYDWQSAVDPSELNNLRDLLLKTRSAQGEREFKQTYSEIEYNKKSRKSAAAICDMKKGEEVTIDKIKYVRVEPDFKSQKLINREDMNKNIGKKINTDLSAEHALSEDMFK